ncbi:MAG: FtsQ-type POTRA domain-containing protein [Bryobacteraceae bacterium]
MARRKARETEDDPQDSLGETPAARSLWRTAFLVSGWTFAAVVVLFSLAWLSWQGETFLIHDKRFRIAPRELDESGDAIRITGIRRASKSAVLAVFDPDRGRSLYELDPEKRRLQLRGVGWVRDAVVRRVWPNRVEVEIFERSPVAFIRVAEGASGDFNNPVKFRPMLIDAEGVILPLQGAVAQSLPLLTGVREEDDVEARRQQVALMTRVLRALRQRKSQIVEVDVSRPQEIRVGCAVGNQTFVLNLGNEQFLERVELFLKQYESMRDQLDPRKEYDLTNEGRILAIDPETSSGAARR